MAEMSNEHYEAYEIKRREIALAHSSMEMMIKTSEKKFRTAYISSYETTSGSSTLESANNIFEFASDTTRDTRYANRRSKDTQ